MLCFDFQAFDKHLKLISVSRYGTMNVDRLIRETLPKLKYGPQQYLNKRREGLEIATLSIPKIILDLTQALHIPKSKFIEFIIERQDT